jgi:hypothetical protein
MSTLDVPGVPFPLTPSAQSTWELDPTDGDVSVIALPHSDIFVAPGAGESAINSVTNLNAATLLSPRHQAATSSSPLRLVSTSSLRSMPGFFRRG